MYIALAFLIVIALIVLVRQSSRPNLPSLSKERATQEDGVTDFVEAFLGQDVQAGELLNPSNIALFAQGYRPVIGVPHNPEQGLGKIHDLKQYFTKKLFLDLQALRPFSRHKFQSFVDEIGKAADQTIICTGEIVMKYDLKVEGRFNFEREFAKVPEGPEKERLKRCWLNDAIIGTEIRMLAWIYGQFFGEPYVNPERR